jgi:hypothetical protein
MLEARADHLRTRARLAIIVVALALIAAPTALGGKPIRSVVPFTEPIFLPAGAVSPSQQSATLSRLLGRRG